MPKVAALNLMTSWRYLIRCILPNLQTFETSKGRRWMQTSLLTLGVSFVLLLWPVGGISNMSCPDDGRFMYFAFGSNLLKERLQLANPSAIFCTTGRLKDYELNFGLWDQHVNNTWHGGVATIEYCPGSEVWGVIWTLSNENLASLDNQEGVSQGLYSPLEVSVETDKGMILCRTYQINNFYACPPSPQYKRVVCLGAEQNGLPTEYLRKLQAIQTNNYSGPSVLDEIKQLHSRA